MTVQLLYIGTGGLIVAGLCQFVDENDRFFTSKISEIPGYQWGVCIGVACIGDQPKLIVIVVRSLF